MNDRLEYRRSLGLPKADEHPFALEAIEALKAEVELYRSRWLSCVTPEEAQRLRDANAKMQGVLKEISAWCADILNADRGEVPYPLREFAEDVYDRVGEGLPEDCK